MLALHCSVTGACLCTTVLAHLDDILGIHSLDKIRETVEESIACSSLEGRKRAEEGSHDLYVCRSKAVVTNESVSAVHLYNNLLLFLDGSVVLAQQLPHPYHLHAPSAENVWLPTKIHRICTEGHKFSLAAEMQVNNVLKKIVSCVMHLNSLTQILFFRLTEKKRTRCQVKPGIANNATRSAAEGQLYLLPIIFAYVFTR